MKSSDETTNSRIEMATVIVRIAHLINRIILFIAVIIGIICFIKKEKTAWVFIITVPTIMVMITNVAEIILALLNYKNYDQE